MDLIIQFIITFAFVYFGYYFLIIRHQKEYNSKTCPGEALFIIKVYKLKLNCINYNKLLKLMALTNAVIISLTITLVSFVNHYLMKFLIGFFILVLLIIIFYSLIGLYYKKRGMTKDV
jgi:hypothetical protein